MSAEQPGSHPATEHQNGELDNWKVNLPSNSKANSLMQQICILKFLLHKPTTRVDQYESDKAQHSDPERPLEQVACHRGLQIGEHQNRGQQHGDEHDGVPTNQFLHWRGTPPQRIAKRMAT